MALRVHSTESFGTVDGPGIRLVVFLQGCPMRCLYCHNPDTWNPAGGTEMSITQIMAQYEKNRPFYRNGGITVTGGEPLMQIPAVTELFSAASHRGIHTCLDTSGVTFRHGRPEVIEIFDQLLSVTDLVMLDIKHMVPEKHLKLCGQPLEPILQFARYLDDKAIPVWIRHVVIPDITYDQNYLYQLGTFIGTLHNVKALDILPYHNMGKTKYQALGMVYPLDDTPPLNQEEASAARQIIVTGIKDIRLVKGN